MTNGKKSRGGLLANGVVVGMGLGFGGPSLIINPYLQSMSEEFRGI